MNKYRIYDILNGLSEAVQKTYKGQKLSESKDSDFLFTESRSLLENEYEETEEENEEYGEDELEEYKRDFYQMSLGSIKSIATHAQAILNAVETGKVKEGLTESWLQGKIALTEDYILTIHNFLMFGETETDTEASQSDESLASLWENIRKKKERMGKKYKPAKPGDKDRPNPESWKKAQK